ncbi:MAG TPA: hypothetical protein PK891_04595, partial [Bacteroidales bacterium]|nr:hypothetical protein [Bacteroidales bacterium]
MYLQIKKTNKQFILGVILFFILVSSFCFYLINYKFIDNTAIDLLLTDVISAIIKNENKEKFHNLIENKEKNSLIEVIEQLKLFAKKTTNRYLQARTYMVIGEIYVKGFNDANIQKKFTKLAIKALKVPLNSSSNIKKLKIPDKYKYSEFLINAPVRIDLADGGSSDLLPISDFLGGKTVSMSVSLNNQLPITVIARRLPKFIIKLVSKDLKSKHIIRDKTDLQYLPLNKNDNLILLKAALHISGIINHN